MKSVVRGTDREDERGAPLKFRVCAKSISSQLDNPQAEGSLQSWTE